MSESKGNDRNENKYHYEEDSPEEREEREEKEEKEEKNEESKIVYDAIKQLRQSLKILKPNFLPHEIDMLKYRIRVMLGITKRKNFDVIEDHHDTNSENIMDIE